LVQHWLYKAPRLLECMINWWVHQQDGGQVATQPAAQVHVKRVMPPHFRFSRQLL